MVSFLCPSKAQRVSALLPGGQTVIYPHGIKRDKFIPELCILEQFVRAWDNESVYESTKPARYLIVTATHHKSTIILKDHKHISLYVSTDNMWNLPQKERSDYIRAYTLGSSIKTGYACHRCDSGNTIVLTEKEMKNINEALEVRAGTLGIGDLRY